MSKIPANECAIIHITAIQQRIEELEWSLSNIPESYIPKHEAQIYALKQILSQSTPLIPEIEKAFNAGDNYRYYENSSCKSIPSDVLDQEDYISNLKLDI